jgi:hypothetical protein
VGLIDVVKILGYGVIGLGFLLAFMAYRLLSAEQKKPKPNEKMLRSIRDYMIFSIGMIIFGGVFLVTEKFVSEKAVQPIVTATPFPSVTPAPSSTAMPGPVTPEPSVRLDESLQGDIRDIELTKSGTALLKGSGTSTGIAGGSARIYFCSQNQEKEWWCQNADISADGSWTAEIYLGSGEAAHPFKTGTSVKLMAVVDSTGATAGAGEENSFPVENIGRYKIHSEERSVKIYLRE